MDSAENIRFLFAVALTVIGLSHIFQGRVWSRFFQSLAEKGEPGAFANALIHLAPGLLIIGFHQVYQGPLLLFTLLGWGWVAKSSLYLMFPSVGVKQMSRGASKPDWVWTVAGGVMLLMAAALGWSL